MLECALLIAALIVLIKPMGKYMARVYSGKSIWLEKPLGFIEQGFYRICAVDETIQMSWRRYLAAIVCFTFTSIIALFCLIRFQHLLPLNPQAYPAPSVDLAFNIAVSFVTNTNWQSYAPEKTLSYFSQMVGLVVQNFLSASVGMAAAVAFFRSFSHKKTHTLGNFWVDMVRGNLYILLPLCVMLSLLLVSQGVVQNFSGYVDYTPLEQTAKQEQLAPQPIAMGPAASQIAIKQLGGNGGGFFNANSAHPFENPTPFSNFLELLCILLIPVSFVYTFGVMVGDKRQSWMVLAAMSFIFIPCALLAISQERQISPAMEQAGIDKKTGNMEGKEVRFGAAMSAFWAVSATATSNGSVNSMHDSFMPLGGMAPLMLIQLGEIIFGGAGSGMIGTLIFIIITVFIGGLMVGRTPEYLGKKFGPFEIKMVSLAIILPSVLILGGATLAVVSEAGRAGAFNPGPQGFSEIIYAVSSASNNNGSGFAGIHANSEFYNILLAALMLLGRFSLLAPALALAGAIAAKGAVQQSAGTLPTHTLLFAGMLVFVIVLMGVLNYVPALALGPVAEHLLLYTY